ncbi:GNAT family N-acetyltransferase [Fusobacterium pseudoperiodonticum]|jgi:acetyltransferase|uniref:GNAT family N-acetyltransferase n=1 Tax=Fusobacterium pseudoperiodonticum TaxID=2663009 RepID=UPI000C1C3201|nr:GNAT family N-acetyltransferase [Fusobacterium pseudoperiodonticum]ATV63092.1 GNAT family N-acetyltransferase [Fusobacterium pseudoperiodonticum]
MKIDIAKNSEDVKAIVKIHIEAFPNFFLTSLGDDLLFELYRSFLETENSGIYIAKIDNKVVGFLAFAEKSTPIYYNILKKHFFSFSLKLFKKFLKNPLSFFKLLYKFKKKLSLKKEEKRTLLKKIRIESIAVEPNYFNKKIGKELIDFLKKNIDFEKFDLIELETDAKNNEKTNYFYQKNEFIKVEEITVDGNRVMNIYHYYGGKK